MEFFGVGGVRLAEEGVWDLITLVAFSLTPDFDGEPFTGCWEVL